MTTTDNRTEINDCNSATGWVGTDSPTLVTGAGLFYESTGAISTQYSNTAAEQMTSTEDTVATGTYTLDMSNRTLYCVVKTNLNETLANGGGMIVVGDATDLIGFEVFGSDELNIILDSFFYGIKMDLSNIFEPTVNAFSGSLAALTRTAIDRVGWGANHLAKANGPSDNVYMDIFRHVLNKGPDNHRPALSISAGTVSVPETIVDTAADDLTSGLGVVAGLGGSVYQIFAPIQWGLTGSADHFFTSTDEIWLLKGRFCSKKHFDFNAEFGSSGDNLLNFTRTTLLGLGTRSNWDLRAVGAGTTDELKMSTVTFSELGQIWSQNQQAGVRFFTSCTFNNCDAFCPGSIDVDDCAANGSNDKFGAVHLRNFLYATMTGWVFTAGGVNGPAVCGHDQRSYDADNWTFNGYSANDATPYDTETDVDGVNDEIDITTHPYTTEDPVVFVPDFVPPALPEDNGLPFAFFDDFGRADESLETATAWTNTAGSACQIVSNVVTGTTGAAATQLNSSVLDNAAQVIEATVSARPAGSGLGMSLTVRAGAGDYYKFEVRDTGGWLIERVGTGAAVLIDGTSASSIDNDINVGDRIRVEVEDDAQSDPEIRVYVDGRFLAYAIDTAATPFATGSCGFAFDATETTGAWADVVVEDLNNVVYVRSVTANSISLHTTAAGAAADTGQIVLTASGLAAGETHRINAANAAFHNQSAGAITYGVLNNGDTPSVWNGPGATTTVNNNVTILTEGVTEGAAVKVIADETVGTITAGDILDERLADSNGEATFSINYEAAFGAGLDVIVRAAHNGLPNAAIIEDPVSTFVDNTTAANSTTVDDMVITADSVQAVDDAYYFGHSEQFTNGPNSTIRLKLEISVAHGAGNPTIVWEFFNGLTWASLTFTDADPNANLTSVGEFIYEWDAEAGWAVTTINSQGPFFYVRARVSGAGTSTNGATGRFTTLDVTKFFRQDLKREITATGLTTSVPWNVNTLALFDPLND